MEVIHEETGPVESREWTRDEIREQFLTHVWNMIEYWNSPNLPSSRSTRERLEGLTHSILTALDGCTMALPGFIVAPCPHPDDREYHIENGENWYPENDESQVNGDIGGGLHELLYSCQPERMKKG